MKTVAMALGYGRSPAPRAAFRRNNLHTFAELCLTLRRLAGENCRYFRSRPSAFLSQVATCQIHHNLR
jgi:hypothetical protein